MLLIDNYQSRNTAVNARLAAVVAGALTAYLDAEEHGRYVVRSVEPVSTAPSGFPNLWALSGRQQLMDSRDLRR